MTHAIRLCTLALILLFGVGCAHQIKVSVDPQRDVKAFSHKYGIIPANIGVYIRPDVKYYIYHQNKMGMTFYIRAGDYIEPISRELVSGLFEGAKFVNSTPPYNPGQYEELDGVVEPEILYVHGHATGLTHGNIVAELKARLKGYDMRGNIIWQSDALGTADSGTTSFVDKFLKGDYSVAGNTGYQAALNAATQLVDNFHERLPPQASALFRIREMQQHSGASGDLNTAKEFFSKGYFAQALRHFKQVERSGRADANIHFYMGVANTNIGNRAKGIYHFEEVVSMSPRTKAGQDARKWINTLKARTPVDVFIAPDSRARREFPGHTLAKMTQKILAPHYPYLNRVEVVSSTGSVSPRSGANTILIEFKALPPRPHQDSRIQYDRDIAETMELVLNTQVIHPHGQKSRFATTESMSTLMGKDPKLMSMLKEMLFVRVFNKLTLSLFENHVF